MRRRNDWHLERAAAFACQQNVEKMMPSERVAAVALLTQSQVEQLGQQLVRLWPVDESPCFTDLLAAIDEADRELRRGERSGD